MVYIKISLQATRVKPHGAMLVLGSVHSISGNFSTSGFTTRDFPASCTNIYQEIMANVSHQTPVLTL